MVAGLGRFVDWVVNSAPSTEPTGDSNVLAELIDKKKTDRFNYESGVVVDLGRFRDAQIYL